MQASPPRLDWFVLAPIFAHYVVRNRGACRHNGAVIVAETFKSLEIEAEPQALRRLVARVVDGTLELRVAPGGFSTDRPVRWRLVIRRLAALSLAGSGSVTLGPLRTSDFVLRAAGSGDLDVQNLAARSLQVDASGSMTIRIAAGRVETQRVVLSGSGDYQASGLVSLDAEVNNRGSGRAAVHAVRSLSARIEGSGDIEFGGHPVVQSTIRGSGSLNPR